MPARNDIQNEILTAKKMKVKLKYLIILIIIMLVGCRTINIYLDSKTSDDCKEKFNKCEECKIQPKSGPNRDLTHIAGLGL